MKTADEMRAALVARAAEDDAFRSQLMAEPKATIKREFDIDVPEDVEIQVHEDSSNTAHLVLPNNATLTEVELARVAGAGKNGALYWCM